VQWLSFTVPLGTALLLLTLPGLVVALIIRLRGLWLAAATPAISLGILAPATIIAPWLSLPWSIVPVLIVAAFYCLIAVVLRRVLRRYERPERTLLGNARSRRSTLLGFALGCVLLLGFLIYVLRTPEAFSQSFDNVFHLNAVRYVLDTANGSPLSVGKMTGLAFYPSLWHATVALVVGATGSSIPAATNAVTLVVCCVTWIPGSMILVRVLVGRRPLAMISAGVLAALFPAYPILVLRYGVLYPFFLGLSVLPLTIALTIVTMRLARDSGGVSRLWAALICVAVLPGIALAHPGALVGWIAFSVPIVACVFLRSARRKLTLTSTLLFASYLAVVVLALHYLRPPASQIYWEPTVTFGQAIGEVATQAPFALPVSLLIAALVPFGAASALRSRRGADAVALGLFILAAVLYVVVAAPTWEPLRYFLTGPWYNNVPRLAALLPVASLPLAVSGAVFLQNLVARSRNNAGARSWTHPGVSSAVVAALGVAIVVQAYAELESLRPAHRIFSVVDNSWLVTPVEERLIHELPRYVPHGVAVAGNPWTGASLAYALAGTKVLMPHLLMEVSPDVKLINRRLNDATPGSPVCDAVVRTRTGFVLDFGSQQVNNAHERMPGLEHLASSNAVALVAKVGSASLYKITGCDT